MKAKQLQYPMPIVRQELEGKTKIVEGDIHAAMKLLNELPAEEYLKVIKNDANR
jgi:hypothetical protein